MTTAEEFHKALKHQFRNGNGFCVYLTRIRVSKVGATKRFSRWFLRTLREQCSNERVLLTANAEDLLRRAARCRVRGLPREDWCSDDVLDRLFVAPAHALAEAAKLKAVTISASALIRNRKGDSNG